MIKKFFVYRYQCDRQGNRYTPKHTLQHAYPEFENDMEIVVEKIETSQTLGKRLGWIEYDETIVDSTWLDNEISQRGIGAMMEPITNTKAKEYIRNNTNYTEVETDKWEIQEADPEMGTEAEYLTIT